MVPRGHWTGEKIDEFHGEYKTARSEEADRAEILDAKYEKIDIDEAVKKQEHLKSEVKEELRKATKS